MCHTSVFHSNLGVFSDQNALILLYFKQILVIVPIIIWVNWKYLSKLWKYLSKRCESNMYSTFWVFDTKLSGKLELMCVIQSVFHSNLGVFSNQNALILLHFKQILVIVPINIWVTLDIWVNIWVNLSHESILVKIIPTYIHIWTTWNLLRFLFYSDFLLIRVENQISEYNSYWDITVDLLGYHSRFTLIFSRFTGISQ